MQFQTITSNITSGEKVEIGEVTLQIGSWRGISTLFLTVFCGDKERKKQYTVYNTLIYTRETFLRL